MKGIKSYKKVGVQHIPTYQSRESKVLNQWFANATMGTMSSGKEFMVPFECAGAAGQSLAVSTSQIL